MTAVFASTDEVPELEEAIHRRHLAGLDTYDEWWEGVYRVVTGPSPEHGRLINKLVLLLDPLAEAVGLHTSAPLNVGVDKIDCKVPDLGVYRPDTPRTSPAFLATALLVVEVLSPGEQPGVKMPFYAGRGVQEYLELDLQLGTAALYRNTEGVWGPAIFSKVLKFDVVAPFQLLDPKSGVVIDVRDFTPSEEER